MRPYRVDVNRAGFACAVYRIRTGNDEERPLPSLVGWEGGGLFARGSGSLGADVCGIQFVGGELGQAQNLTRDGPVLLGVGDAEQSQVDHEPDERLDALGRDDRGVVLTLDRPRRRLRPQPTTAATATRAPRTSDPTVVAR